MLRTRVISKEAVSNLSRSGVFLFLGGMCKCWKSGCMSPLILVKILCSIPISCGSPVVRNVVGWSRWEGTLICRCIDDPSCEIY